MADEKGMGAPDEKLIAAPLPKTHFLFSFLLYCAEAGKNNTKNMSVRIGTFFIINVCVMKVIIFLEFLTIRYDNFDNFLSDYLCKSNGGKET